MRTRIVQLDRRNRGRRRSKLMSKDTEIKSYRYDGDESIPGSSRMSQTAFSHKLE